jgi:hypothetical protein
MKELTSRPASHRDRGSRIPRIARLLVLLALSLSVGVGYWWYQPHLYRGLPPYRSIHTLASFHEHGVRVDLAIERDFLGTLVLASTYTPDDPTSHLYSVDLPRGGIDGIGRPTLLEMPAQPGIETLGPVGANRAVLYRSVEGFATVFPIYPDGAVTLRQPIRVLSEEPGRMAEVRVTYMACSSRGYCMPPVIGKQLVVPFTIEGAE